MCIQFVKSRHSFIRVKIVIAYMFFFLIRHFFFILQQVVQTILDTLTPDDIRVLTESIDEDGRKGGFQRVFPTPTTYKYLKFFESARYYNLLLNQWVQRYNRMEQRGEGIFTCLLPCVMQSQHNNYDHIIQIYIVYLFIDF